MAREIYPGSEGGNRGANLKPMNSKDDEAIKGMPDWLLVHEALSSLEFLRDLVEPENQSKEVRQVIAHHINEKNGIAPLSSGAVIAFAYIVIVYPKEREMFGYPRGLIPHGFEESEPSKTTKGLIEHLRHALSHGDYAVWEKRILFSHKSKHGKLLWEAFVTLENLISFLHDFSVQIHTQHYIGMGQRRKN